MRLEVHSAADFLMNLLRVRQVNSPLSESQLLTFKGSLQDVLLQRYRSHWYPEIPTKGSGYRCIRINGKMDPVIEQAGTAVGLNSRQLKKMLPQELTMWIDPDEVSYRIGENGSICVLFNQDRASPSSDLDSTGSGVNSEEYAIEKSRFEITPDFNKLVLDFFEKSNSTIITKPKVHHYRNRNNNQHYNNNSYHQYSGNPYQHNISLGSNGQISPPLSPQQHQQQQSLNSYHQQSHNRYQQPHFSSPPSKFITNNHEHQPYYNWDYHHNKVRTQC